MYKLNDNKRRLIFKKSLLKLYQSRYRSRPTQRERRKNYIFNFREGFKKKLSDKLKVLRLT